MMVRQIASLLLLFMFFSFAIAYSVEPSVSIATRLVEVFGAVEAINVANRGPVPAYATLKLQELQILAPWFAAGMICALAARFGLWRWTKPPTNVDVVRLRDEADCTIEMWGTPLSHDPGIRFLPVVDPQGRLAGATPFEAECLGVILAAGDIPFDAHANTPERLATYVESAWGHIVESHGAGSLAAMLVIAHQTGKVLAFKKEKGRWVTQSDKYAQASSVVVRRIRSFYTLPRALRNDLMLCLDVLASNMVPTDLPEHLHAVIRDVRIADLVPPSGTSQSAATDDDNSIDIRKIATLVSSGLLNEVATLNINQARAKSESLAGLFLKSENVVLLPPKVMRDVFSNLLPAEISALLKLDVPAASRHPSDDILRQVMQATGDLVTVINQVSAPSGNYAVRSGERKFNAMWALSTKKVKAEDLAAWGEWSYEIEIVGEGDLKNVS